MGKRIGIFGAGIAGLHLGLYLRQNGVEAVIFTDRTPEDYANARLLNTAAHHGETLHREAELGIDHHWQGCEYSHHRYFLNGPDRRGPCFEGSLGSPSRLIDHRVYLPRLMKDFVDRGGKIEHAALAPKDLAGKIDSAFDLLAVCTGKGPLGHLFDYQPERSPYHRPQRLIAAGLFTGIAEDTVKGAGFCLNAGIGEIIECSPTLTFGGSASTIIFEAVPGREFEVLAKLKYEDDPRSYLKAVLDTLRRFHPALAERVDEKAFDLANGPRDLLQGAVTPTIRNSHVVLASGTIALAVGDVHVLVDPVMAQGANISSHSAWIVGEEIVATDRFDEVFVERVQQRRMPRSLGASEWTNYMLRALKDPPAELQQLFLSMSADRRLADEFTANFNRPEVQWARMSTPSSIRSWMRGQMPAVLGAA